LRERRRREVAGIGAAARRAERRRCSRLSIADQSGAAAQAPHGAGGAGRGKKAQGRSEVRRMG
jgi:hypothetical protein